MNEKSQITDLKKEILIKIVEAFYSDDFAENVRRIPYKMRPSGCAVPYRCCVHKERAILRDRTLAGLGLSIENSVGMISLSEYARQALERETPEEHILTVLHDACQGCAKAATKVTDLCQGCVARPCVGACKLGAIDICKGRASIIPDKCKNCGRCHDVCPYNAIVKIRVPCEDICPVDAISKMDDGNAQIDFEKCISCGRCVGGCPFGAIHEKSQIVDILKKIKQGKEVIALVAPSIVGQFNFGIEKLASALKQIGFSQVYEVAYGADITARLEAKEFSGRMAQGDPFMTTSCCNAYMELVRRHMPDMVKYVSETKTPAHHSAKLAKEENPGCITVFVSPCTTKRKEGLIDPEIDYVLNFVELNDIFSACKINLSECKETEFKHKSSAQGRGFPATGGVAKAVGQVVNCGKCEHAKLKPHLVSGFSKLAISNLKKYAKTGVCSEGNLIEIMACTGGCIGGNACLNPVKTALGKIEGYSKESFDLEP
ncbi:putative [FeFe] hydrogenase group B1/B3 [Candidatus Gastranaerophilus sp. (ex Termes propinquus)]|nr:putative [FeFe] hydrogenase group B1/B3 [Candidatus Gastranaerophilus sp. (ex Termes propinquus)]